MSNMNQQDKADEFFKAKIKNMVSIAENQNYAKFSNFLDARQQHMALQVLQSCGCRRYSFFGGYEDAERKMLCVYPDYQQEEDLTFPCDILAFRFPKMYELTHRDFLGAIMATQIKRETIGDILVGEGQAVLFVQQDLTEYIQNNLCKIGNVGVQIEKVEHSPLQRQQKYELLTGTVASLRIDSVLHLITKLSRSKAGELIAAGRVQINYEEVSSLSTGVKPQDIISVRGYGKYMLTDEIHLTKKERYHIAIQKFI